VLNQRSAYFRGPQFDGADESGIQTVEPPIRIADYGMRVPQLDADSNDTLSRRWCRSAVGAHLGLLRGSADSRNDPFRANKLRAEVRGAARQAVDAARGYAGMKGAPAETA
jgi:hypothetical protein